MRRNKNITLNLQNITAYFTGKAKIITLSLVIIMLSFANIINTSALSYQSNVGIDFTFNPTLSINISPSDLIIGNLTPGTVSDSNIINVSVATNSAYGYILTTSVGNNTIYSTTNLAHTNGSSIFSSISTNANLTSLEDVGDNNIWGYSYKLSGDNTWSNYSGLPLYNSPLKVLINTDSNTETGPNSLDFKIAAKASTAQPSGAYSNVINFSAVTKPTPTTLAEAYANYYQATNRTMHNGYYVMQDMADSHICENTEVIGSELQVIDIRDDKVYWIAKLADGHCWMTQNLDLDLDSNRIYTYWDTDLGWSTINENETWKPTYSTTDFTGINVSKWQNSNTTPYSANPGDVYYYTSDSDANDIQYNSLQECAESGHTDCAHYHAGNYYNWSAAVANNNTSGATSDDIRNSLCPSGWKLPAYIQNEFGVLLYKQEVITSISSNTYTPIGFVAARKKPLYLIRSGGIFGNSLTFQYGGLYWTDALRGANAYNLLFNNTVKISDYSFRQRGLSVRCLTR